MLTNRETRIAAVRNQPLDLDVVDTGAGWPPPDASLESIDRPGLPLDRDLDAAIWSVADPAANRLAFRQILGKVPEADALHSAAEDVPPRNQHGDNERAMIHRAGRRHVSRL